MVLVFLPAAGRSECKCSGTRRSGGPEGPSEGVKRYILELVLVVTTNPPAGREGAEEEDLRCPSRCLEVTGTQ